MREAWREMGEMIDKRVKKKRMMKENQICRRGEGRERERGEIKLKIKNNKYRPLPLDLS